MTRKRKRNVKAPERTQAICYICCGPGADSEDHVIAECFFPRPVPKNLLKLPAHKSCHGRLPEGWLRNLIVPLSAGSGSRSAVSLYDGPVRNAFASDVGFHRETMAGLARSEDVYTPAGVYLGTSPVLHFDSKRVHPPLEKIIRGLYLHHTGRLLPRASRFRWLRPETPYRNLDEHFRLSAPGLSYGDVFECRYVFARDTGLEASLWWLRFYCGPVFRYFVTTPAVT